MKNLLKKSCFLFLIFNYHIVTGQFLQKVKQELKNVERKIEEQTNKQNTQKKETSENQATEKKAIIRDKPKTNSQVKGYTISSANNRFNSISLQQYKNLPRVGDLNTFNMNSGEDRSGAIADYKTTRNEYLKYYELLRMKFLYNLYLEMDLEMPYKVENNRGVSSIEDRKSALAQNNLLRVAKGLITSEAYPDYFCNSKRECKVIRGDLVSWGGSGANEFEQIESYQKFVKENLSDLKKMSKEIEDEAYLVSLFSFKQYDFEQGGFPLHISFSSNYGKTTFVPINDYEMHLKDNRNLNKILKMSSSEAKELLERNKKRQLFAVCKIKYHNIEKSA